MDNALNKARVKNGKITESTPIVTQQDQSYGDAGVISYSEMKLVDILKNLATTYNSLLDKAKVPEEAWQPEKTFFVRDRTEVISGAIDQGLEEAKEIPELVGLGLSLVSDPQGAKDKLSTLAQSMDWPKAKTLAKEIAKGAVYADEFEKGGIYALHGTGRLGVTIALTVTAGGLLAVIADAPNQLKKKLEDALALIANLRQQTQTILRNFSDETLVKFSNDLADPAFFEWVNDAANEKYVRGFVNHKLTEADMQDIGGLLTELENLDDLPPQVKKWLENSQSSERFKYYRDLGGAFEKAMRTALTDAGSAAYKGLKNVVPDLDQRTILSQVQFCINGKSACNNAGEYFIADFVAVVEKTDALGTKYLDAVIIDTKLSKGTDFTPNQKVANGLGSLTIKSTTFQKIKGPDISNDLLMKGKDMTKQSSIRKMWSDGNGNYQNIE